MALVLTLTACDQDHFGPPLPPGLRELYYGDLRFRESPASDPLSLRISFPLLTGSWATRLRARLAARL